MQTKNMLILSGAFAAGLLITALNKSRKMNSAQLIEKIITKGFSEIQNSKLALEKSNSTSIKIFAQRMIDDHNSINQQLMTLARSKNLSTPDLEKYMDGNTHHSLSFSSEESFDEDYVNHQLGIHKEMIKLFRMSERAEDIEIRKALSGILDQLGHHLQMTKDLADTFRTNNIPTSSSQRTEYVEEPDYKI